MGPKAGLSELGGVLLCDVAQWVASTLDIEATPDELPDILGVLFESLSLSLIFARTSAVQVVVTLYLASQICFMKCPPALYCNLCADLTFGSPRDHVSRVVSVVIALSQSLARCSVSWPT